MGLESFVDFAFIPAGSYNETLALIELGEGLGYRGAWLPDQGFHRDPFALLGIAALRTRRIQLGLGITSPFTRLPVQIARGAATIDEISRGRFNLGLGTANVANILTPLGIKLSRPVGRLRDAINIIRALLRGESVEFGSQDDILRGVSLDFTATRMKIPIYLGTRGPQTLALAGELVDGVLVESLFNADGLPYVFENIRKGAARSGRDLNTFDAVSWQMVQVTDDEKSAIDAQKPWLVRTIRVGPAHALERVGMDPMVIEAVNVHLDKGDREAATAEVTDETVRCTMIIGSPDYVASRVTQVLKSDINSMNLLLLGPSDELRVTLQRFAKEVWPLVRI